MTMEAQAIANEPTLSNYIFYPIGVRHDNPIYSFNNIAGDNNKVEALNKFIEFATNDANQNLATKMGFNQYNEYSGSEDIWSGDELYRAQALWKKNKSGGKTNVAVFVSDCSGSMKGTKMESLKLSLLNGMQYISTDSEIGLVSFSDDVIIELPIGKLEGIHRSKFQSAVKNMSIRGNTHIYSGTLVAIKMIQDYKQKNPNANFMIFVLSDGENTGGVSEQIVAQLIKSYGITVHCIGYGSDADMDSMKRLASYTEGFSEQINEDNVIYNMKNIFNSQM